MEEADPGGEWEGLTDVKDYLGHDFQTFDAECNCNVSTFQNYDDQSLYEKYMALKTDRASFNSFTVQTFAFTFNNRKMDVIELIGISEYNTAPPYQLMITLLLVIVSIFYVIRPITRIVHNTSVIKELIDEYHRIQGIETNGVWWVCVFLHVYGVGC